MSIIYFDTETCGLHGPIVILQWAEDNGEVNIQHVWKEPIRESLQLIEHIVENNVCAFNLSFDWFHICQLYTTLSRLDFQNHPPDISDYAAEESAARFGPCLKPKSALDLMLYARKGPFQSTMNRKDIKIKKVPNALAVPLMQELEKRVQLDDIYFARRKKKGPKWGVFERKDDPDFKDIVLKFKPSSSLKSLALYALNIDPEDLLQYRDISLPKHLYPDEKGWKPFVENVDDPKSWPNLIEYHIEHWQQPEPLRYAMLDVEYLQKLYDYFGRPEFGDNDSELAICVAASRWRGYKLDIEKLKTLRDSAIKKSKGPKSPSEAKAYIGASMGPIEKMMFTSTNKVALEDLGKQVEDCDCELNFSCEKCHGTGEVLTETAKRAKRVVEARKAKKEVELYNKLIEAGRFHPDFNVIGDKSSRMSGTSGLNAQGIKNTKEVKSCFTLADDGEQLDAGDFKSFEVSIAIAVYDDERLAEEMTAIRECACGGKADCKVCKGKGKFQSKIHAMFGTYFYPHLTYEQIIASEKTENDYYTKSKSGLFTVIYFGTEFSLRNKLGVDQDVAVRSKEQFLRDHPKTAAAQNRIRDMFCAMKQPGGIGTRVEWHEPAEYIEEPVTGHRRYFTLENRVCKALFDLGNRPPAAWRKINVRVVRRDREQTASGAVQSALYAAAFGLQQANTRGAGNHVVQAAGAVITKTVQRRIWDLQPQGIHEFVVRPMNIHDQVLCPNTIPDQVANVVQKSIESFRDRIPLLAIDWGKQESWAD